MQLTPPATFLAAQEEEYLQEQIEFRKAYRDTPNTHKSYQHDLTVFQRWLRANGHTVEKLTKIILHQFFLESSKTRKRSTIERYRAAITRFFPELMEEKEIVDFFVSLKNNKCEMVSSSVPLLKDDFLKKWRKIKDIKYKFLLLLQFKGAFRIKELLNLNLADVQVEGASLLITLYKTKNNKDPVIVGVKNGGIDMVKIFKQYVKEYNITDKLFKLTRDGALKWVKRNFGKEYGTHSMRSGFITSAIKAKMPLPVIMAHSRHKNATVFANHYYKPATVLDNPSDII